jgi:hypothetical protein
MQANRNRRWFLLGCQGHQWEQIDQDEPAHFRMIIIKNGFATATPLA